MQRNISITKISVKFSKVFLPIYVLVTVCTVYMFIRYNFIKIIKLEKSSYSKKVKGFFLKKGTKEILHSISKITANPNIHAFFILYTYKTWIFNFSQILKILLSNVISRLLNYQIGKNQIRSGSPKVRYSVRIYS